MPVRYKGQAIDVNYRIDVLVEDRVLLELRAVETLLPLHEAQLLTYMKLSGMRVGLPSTSTRRSLSRVFADVCFDNRLRRLLRAPRVSVVKTLEV